MQNWEHFQQKFYQPYIDAEKEGVDLAKKIQNCKLSLFSFLDENGELVQYDYGYYNAKQFLTVGYRF